MASLHRAASAALARLTVVSTLVAAPGALVVAASTVALVLSAPSEVLAKPATFTLEVTPRRGSVSDTFFATVVVEVQGVKGADRYWPPRFPGFELVDTRTDQNSSMRVDPKQGRTLMTQTIYRYQLRPKRPGNFYIEPARVRLAGVEHETRGAYVVVRPTQGDGALDDEVAGSRAPDPTASGGIGAPGFSPPDPYGAEPLFIHPVTDKKQVWVGEQVTATWLLYTRQEILKFEPRAPQVEGTWSEVLHEPEGFFKYHDAMVGRRAYSVVIVSKRAIFPTQPGRIRIHPFRGDVVTLGAALGKAVRVRSRSVVLRVKPLPKGAPEGFDPTYVGRFAVTAQADRDELDAGESLILELAIRGSGAIRRLAAPRLELEGFDIREARDVEEKIETSGNVVSGSRVYRYWVTPKKGGPQSLPSIGIPYFDPETGEYKEARTRPIPILVRGDPGEVERAPVGDTRENVITRDIRLIHGVSQVDSRLLPTLYRRWWFLLLLAAPPLIFVLVVLADRILQRMRKETPRARLRRARGNARKRFRLAEIHLRGNRPGKFFGELARVIYEHLEERLDRPLQSLTREDLAGVLADAGLPRTTVERVTRELDRCDAARFSPLGSSRSDMETAMGRVKELLKRIESTRLAADEEASA